MKKQYTERELLAQLQDPAVLGVIAILNPEFLLIDRIRNLSHYSFRMFITFLCLTKNTLLVELFVKEIMTICNSQQSETTKKALVELHNLNLITVHRNVRDGYEMGKKPPINITLVDPKDYLKDRQDLLTLEGL